MLLLVDTGILLRLFNRNDPACIPIRKCLLRQKRRGHQLVVATQNIAEFWNVSTRPAAARGGYGLSVEETNRRVTVIEKICSVLPEPPTFYPIWRNLLITEKVHGVHVHDSRLVAWMRSQAITHVITLNGPDFARYADLAILSPFEATAA